MVDYCLKLSLQPWIHSHFPLEIMNSMKSVTIMMIDGVRFIAFAHLHWARAGSLEMAISVMAAVYTSCDSQFPKALTDCRIKNKQKGNIIKRH